jgi:hypothetical protein
VPVGAKKFRLGTNLPVLQLCIARHLVFTVALQYHDQLIALVKYAEVHTIRQAATCLLGGKRMALWLHLHLNRSPR